MVYTRGSTPVELEKQMQQVDWKEDHTLYEISDPGAGAELKFNDKVEKIMEQLEQLKADLASSEILMQLQLKYWADAGVFNDMIEAETWSYYKDLPVRRYEFEISTDVKTAFNLMCGRAMPDNLLHPWLPESFDWIMLDLIREEPEVTVASFAPSRLIDILLMLPIRSEDYTSLLYPLTQGSIVEATLRNNKKIFLEANPEKQSVNIYSENMRSIQANLWLDDQWNPAETNLDNHNHLEKEQNRQNHKIKHPVRFKRNKGRGL